MTFIATFASGPIGFLLADTLITTERKPPDTGSKTLAISGREIPAHISLNQYCPIYMSSYRRKVFLINNRLAIAWAGAYRVAYIMVKEIDKRLKHFEGDAQLLGDNLQDILIKMPDEDRLEISFVALALASSADGNRPYYLGYGADQWINPSFKQPFFVAGTGTYLMQEHLQTIADAPSLHINTADPPELLALSAAIGAIAIQHFYELLGAEGLDYAFGGPFDIVFRRQGSDGSSCIEFIPEISFSYWPVKHQSDGTIDVGMPNVIIYQKYVDDSLITATQRIEFGDAYDETGKPEIIRSSIVGTAIATIDSKSISESVRKFQQDPHFHPNWHLLLFFEQIEDEYKSHYVLLFNDERFSVSLDRQGLKMDFDPTLLDPVRNWYAAQAQNY